ncbi:3-isopropylmalate dehydratase small subunit [Geodia barretti]|uniref:3-isopropylmalate dehydratase n=1 Tax=Geodia barretti TaxID=519541 RepID=A0AA35RDU7_GEOBA|nr:3-isopropylmalate dehydratase small subunit [Geodia barretti]
MEPFINLSGVVAHLDQVNVDTDMIIPAVYLKSIERVGFGPHLFDRYRYLEDGSENPDFILNQSPFRHSKILVSGPNFGCGSSREHAPWALEDFGIRCVIAPSFADIFYNNCFKNGLLPLILPEAAVREIIDKSKNSPGLELTVDLEAQQVRDNDEDIVVDFQVDEFRRYCLLNGLDDIGLTLQHEDAISAFESRQSS